MPRQCLFPYRSRASILIVSLWILVFFSILAVALYKIISTRINIARRIEDKAISQYLARSAAVLEFCERKKKKTNYDTLFELRQKKEKELGDGKFIYYIVDEESKVNINTVPVEVMARLPGLDMDLAQEIKSSKLRPFHIKEEVLLVEGITQDSYLNFRDFITVYTQGKVNINTAGPEVLKALGFEDALVKIIQDFRKGEDKEEATEDDGVFDDAARIIDKLRAATGFSGSLEAKLLQVISHGLIGVASENLFLEIDTQVLGRAATKYAVLIGKEKIKEWREW